MTTYFRAPDGHGEPTLWIASDDPRFPLSVLRRKDLGYLAHHWDEIVSRVIAGNPSAARNKLVNAIDDLTRTPSPPSQGLMQVMPEWKPPPRVELTEDESDEFTAALQWDTPSPSYRPGCDHPNVKTSQFCPDCGTLVMVSQL